MDTDINGFVTNVPSIPVSNKKILDTKIRLGQFLTSDEVADFMTSLSDIHKDLRVLEPSAGKGVFIKSLERAGFKDITAIEFDTEFYNHLQNNYDVKLENTDFLGTSINDKYHLIIGNPPYVQWNNIEPSIRTKLMTNPFWKKYVNGEWDLAYAFIIWSIEKLYDGGELIFIVPYNWFNSTHAKGLRNYLVENGYFQYIFHFGELRLFKDCAPNNIIFKYIKSNGPKPKCMVCDYPGRKADIPKLLHAIKSYIGKGS